MENSKRNQNVSFESDLLLHIFKILLGSLLGIHIIELLNCQRALGVLGILTSFMVLDGINFILGLILLIGTTQVLVHYYMLCNVYILITKNLILNRKIFKNVNYTHWLGYYPGLQILFYSSYFW